jgi:hypothetical protein
MSAWLSTSSNERRCEISSEATSTVSAGCDFNSSRSAVGSGRGCCPPASLTVPSGNMIVSCEVGTVASGARGRLVNNRCVRP